jgi:dsDNA-binding SOS-regulon protein
MVEKALIEYSYDIDEEIIKEDMGFVHKIMSNDEDIVDKIVKCSKNLERELKNSDLTTADEKLKPLLEVFAKHKGKISYSFDTFENGVIRVFESNDEKVAKQLHNAADILETTDKERTSSEAKAAKVSDKEETSGIEEWSPENIIEEGKKEAFRSEESEAEEEDSE